MPDRPDRTDRKVDNPIGYAEEQRKAERQSNLQLLKITTQNPTLKQDEEFEILSEEQGTQGDIVSASGNVQATGNGMLVIADRLTYNKVTYDLIAEGNVYFEQEGQKLVGERLEMNVRTKRGSVFSPTGFTNRTPDGTSVTIDASRADKTGEDTFNLDNALITACADRVPKWAFTAKRARIRVDHTAKVYNAFFRVKGIPLLWVPYASVSISKKDRSSGFFLPSSGQSNIKGRTFHVAYYQTLGRSADLLVRTDYFSRRGIGLGFDFRARTNETSRIYIGSFLVWDGLFGKVLDKNGNEQPNASGSSFYVDAVHNFKNGFTAVADVNITSSFNFRNVFGENVLTAVSPEERSIFYLNKNWRSYSFNALFGEQSFFIGNQIVKTRQFPAVEFNKRSTRVADKFPVYFSFDSSLGGVRRSETSGDTTFLKTPSIVQRLDVFPRLTLPLKSVGGFTLTPSFAVRSTFYSDSLSTATNRQVVGVNLFRNFVEFTADLRAPAFAKVFRHRDGQPWFKHLIEPFAVYRRLAGVSDFSRVIRTDERDAIAETNEIEYGIANKFFTKRKSADGKSTQAHEWLDLTVSQKYFFDPTFGGAFQPCSRAVYNVSPANCSRNQFFPINTMTGFSYGGILRDRSPLTAKARLRPNDLVFADVRLNYDTEFNALRELIFGGGLVKDKLTLSNNWYYTRLVKIDEKKYGLPTDPSSQRGNQTDISAFWGNPLRGLYVGSSVIYDLRQKDLNRRNLIFLQAVGGYAWDCCSLQVQRFTFNAGQRNENRYIFSFTLKGIGTFGTQNIGQRRY